MPDEGTNAGGHDSFSTLIGEAINGWLGALDRPQRIVAHFLERHAALRRNYKHAVGSAMWGLERVSGGVLASLTFGKYLLPEVVARFRESRNFLVDLPCIPEGAGQIRDMYPHSRVHRLRLEVVSRYIESAQCAAIEEMLSHPATAEQMEEIRQKIIDHAREMAEEKNIRTGNRTNISSLTSLLGAKESLSVRNMDWAGLNIPIATAYWLELASRWPELPDGAVREVPEEEWARNLSGLIPLFLKEPRVPLSLHNSTGGLPLLLAIERPVTEEVLRENLKGTFTEEVCPATGHVFINYHSNLRRAKGRWKNPLCAAAIPTQPGNSTAPDPSSVDNNVAEFLTMFGLSDTPECQGPARGSDHPYVPATAPLFALIAGVIQSGVLGKAIPPSSTPRRSIRR